MATYYYAEGGTAADKESATSGTYPGGCMSPATCNSESSGFSPGDFVLASDQGGDIRLTLGAGCADGTNGSEITWGAKVGESPIINGADIITGWTVYSGSVYQATVTTQPQQVFIDESFGDRKASIGECVGDLDWYWASNVLYLYCSTGDPDTEYTSPGVEASQRLLGLSINSDYIIVDGVDARFTNRTGIGGQQAGNNVLVKNCLSEWNWYTGIAPASSGTTYTDWTIEDNVCRYNGVGGIALGIIVDDCTIRRNTCYENGKYQPAGNSYDEEQYKWSFGIKVFEDTVGSGIEIYENVCYSNGRGEAGDQAGAGCGIWFDHCTATALNPNLAYSNFCYDNCGIGIFIEISSYCYVFGNVLWDNAIAGMSGWPANIVVDCRISFTTENNLVYNNTCVGGQYGLRVGAYQLEAGMSISDNSFVNNIFVGATEQQCWVYYGGDNDQTHGSGNLYSANCFGAESTGFLWVGGGPKQDTYEAFLSAMNANENIQPDNNWEDDPVFEDESNHKYWLSSSDTGGIGTAIDLGGSFSIGMLPLSMPGNVLTSNRDNY